jgi:hippurate hydrolase
MRNHRASFLIAVFFVCVGVVFADGSHQGAAAVPEIAGLEPELEALYRDLHQNPELGFQEKRTAQELATRVKELGYDVTTGSRAHGNRGAAAKRTGSCGHAAH